MIQVVETDPKKQEAIIENFCSETMYGSSEGILEDAIKKEVVGLTLISYVLKVMIGTTNIKSIYIHTQWMMNMQS